MATKFTAESINDLVKFLRDQADKASAAGCGLTRNKSDRRYYEGKKAALNELALMLERGELEIAPPPVVCSNTEPVVNSYGLHLSQPNEDELVLRERAQERHSKELEDAALELNSQDKTTRISVLKGLFATYACSNLWQPRFAGDSILRIIEQLPKSPNAAALRSVLRRRHTDIVHRVRLQQGKLSGFEQAVYENKEGKAHA